MIENEWRLPKENIAGDQVSMAGVRAWQIRDRYLCYCARQKIFALCTKRNTLLLYAKNSTPKEIKDITMSKLKIHSSLFEKQQATSTRMTDFHLAFNAHFTIP